ncbi:MAG: tetratricopeptide repeat protein [bacterium]
MKKINKIIKLIVSIIILSISNMVVANDLKGEMTFQECKKAVIKKQSFENYSNLGLVCCNEKKYGEAILSYKRALEIDSKQPFIHLQLGKLYQLSNEYKKAIEEYRKVEKSKYIKEDLYIKMAECYSMQGKYNYTVKYLKKQWKTKGESLNTFVSYLDNMFKFNEIKQEEIYKNFINSLM